MKFFPVTSTTIFVEALPQDHAIGGYIFEFSVGIVQNKRHTTKWFELAPTPNALHRH